MSSVGGTTQADASAAAWRGEAAAAAEAYTEEQAAQAARERDEAERRAGAQAQQQTQPHDGVDPPPAPGDESIFAPAAGPRAGTGAATAAGSGNQAIQLGTPIELSEAKVNEYRELGLTVTSAGDGKYIVNAPYNPAHDVRVTEQAPLEAPDDLPQLPPETPTPRPETPAGAAPSPDVDAGAAVENKPPTDPDKVETGLGEKVDKIVNDIPLLKNHLKELKEDNWTIKFGKAGVGGINEGDKIIYIDPSLKDHPGKVAAVLAHEVGHARHPAANVSMDGLTREQYVQQRVEALLDAEGAASLEATRYQESARNNGVDLDIAGFQDDTYRGIYDQMRSKQISEEEAIHRMGQVAGDGELHGDSRVLYRDHFTQAAEQDWDDEHPGGR